MSIKDYQARILDVLLRYKENNPHEYGYPLGYGNLGSVVWPSNHSYLATYRKQGVAMNASKAIKRLQKMGMVHEGYVAGAIRARITEEGERALKEYNNA